MNVKDEYNHSYVENIINHTQYIGNGYIVFENADSKMKRYVYNESANKNFECEITCKVYEYEGKYVIDDFEGLDMKKIKRSNLFLKIFIALWFALIIFVLYKNVDM